VWVSRTGVEQQVVDQTRSYLNPRLSPEGDRIVVQAGGIWTLDLPWKAFELLPTQNAASNAFPAWLPDGRHVIIEAASGCASRTLVASSRGERCLGRPNSTIPAP
jgi:Tol biopolymer transport system component